MTSKVSRCSQEFKVLIQKKGVAGGAYLQRDPPPPAHVGQGLELAARHLPTILVLIVGRRPEGCELRGKDKLVFAKGRGPLRHCVAFCDIALVDLLAAGDLWAFAVNIWQNCLLEGSRMVVRNRTKPGAPWLLTLRPVPSTASFALALDMCTVGEGPKQMTYFKFAKQEQLHFVAVLRLDDWEAMAIDWRSPAFLYTRLGSSAPVGCVALASGLASSLVATAARQAFYTLPVAKMRAIASALGVGHVLGCSEREAFDIVSSRVWRYNRKVGGAINALMEFDEADDMLTKQDQGDLTRTQKSLKEDKAHQAELVAKLHVAREEAEAKSLARSRPAAKANAAAARAQPWGNTAYPVPVGAITQEQASQVRCAAARLCVEEQLPGRLAMPPPTLQAHGHFGPRRGASHRIHDVIEIHVG